MPKNAESPIVFRPFGSETVSTLIALSNARLPTFVTPSFTMTDVTSPRCEYQGVSELLT